MDALLPRTQFVVTLDRHFRGLLPRGLPTATCRIPAPQQQPHKLPSRLPRRSILLLDLDSRLPNLALMKLSRHFKDQGKRVILARREARVEGVERAYASAVFSTACTLDRLAKLKKYYGDSLVAGGTGIDIRLRLPPAMREPPGGLRSLPGTRGPGHRISHTRMSVSLPFLRSALERRRRTPGQRSRRPGDAAKRKLILLDDDLLAHPKAKVFLEDMVQEKPGSQFQSDPGPQIRRRGYRRSSSPPAVLECAFHPPHGSLQPERQPPSRASAPQIRHVRLYGQGQCGVRVHVRIQHATLAQDVERFRFLRSLPGAYVFVQPYRPLPGGKPANLAGFFDEHAEALIDELTRIVFPQNMKSMENYYRWISRLYARKNLAVPICLSWIRFSGTISGNPKRALPGESLQRHRRDPSVGKGAKHGKDVGASRPGIVKADCVLGKDAVRTLSVCAAINPGFATQ